MKIELHGIIQYSNQGHKHTKLVVSEDRRASYVQHELEVDIKLDRDMILNFLSEKYGVQQGDIVWPAHIEVPGGDVGLTRPL